MKYKSVEKYLSKNNKFNCSKKSAFLYRFILKLFFAILLVLICLIFLKHDKSASDKIYDFLYNNNISFASLNQWYQSKFGDILPFQNIVKDSTKLVFNENLIYEDASIYKDGVKLNVEDNYLVPIVESGIVVFTGNKDDYGNTVIIEQVDGVSVWYGNIKNVNVSLYDYVTKGEFLAEANKSFYMVFQKNGEYLNYKDYLK